MAKTTRRVEVCKCENCGNEAEMTIVCELVDVDAESPSADEEKGTRQKEKRSITCVNCGNEADMIVDL